MNTNGDWGGNQPLEGQDAEALQILRDVPEGVLNYAPDVPTPDEIALPRRARPRRGHVARPR
ncbi:MAG: hypothetical protein U0521_15365 [Anaerolineae bacterium]